MSTRFTRTIAALTLASAVGLVALGSVGCRRNSGKSPAELVGQLQSPEWKDRQKAADLLAKDGPPLEAAPYLLHAIQHEQEPKAYGAMLIALGGTGAMEAKPLIDAAVQNPSEDMRRWARRALQRWLVRNMVMSPDGKLPDPPHPLYGPIELPPGAPGAQPLPGYGAQVEPQPGPEEPAPGDAEELPPAPAAPPEGWQ